MIQASNPILKQRVRDLGLRMTPQRQLILEAIGRSGEHATFDEIYQQVCAVAPDINRATLYRTLETFSRYRLIHGNEVAGGRVYELVGEPPHHHLICHRCWGDIRLADDEVQRLFNRIDQETGFRVLGEHYVFMGLCPDCREQHGDRLGRFDRHPKFQTTAHKEEQDR